MTTYTPTITQRHLIGFKARYHRNGIAGEPFFLCAWHDTNARVILNAVVFEDAARTAVFNPQNIEDRYRGDSYAKPLREALQAIESAQPDSLYVRQPIEDISGSEGGAK